MADTREGEDRVVDRPEGKSHEKVEGSAPQIHRQGSSARGGPSLGTSSSKHGDLPGALQKREKGSDPRVSVQSPKAMLSHLKAAFLPRRDSSSSKLRKRADALKRGEEVSEEGSSTKRHSETGKGSSVNKSLPGDSVLNQGGDLVGLLRHKEQLIKLLLEDESGTMNVLAREIQSNDNRLFCLLYLSIFPENSKLSCKKVSRLWAAEGFLPDLGEAEVFFDDLLKRECIHPVETRSDGELSTFQVDKRLQEILVTITSQDGTSSSERVRALHEEKNFQLASVSVLDVSSNEDKTTTSEALPSKVSDLTGEPFQNVQHALFKLTDPNLKYLSLRETSIKVIPDSIGKLEHLEFLDAKHSLVTELPQQVARLQKIRHILIYHHEKDPMMESYNLIGFKASCRVGGFLDLEKLCFVEADKATLEDLGNLTKLRRLGITKLRMEHGESLCNSLEKLEMLKSLNVHALDEDEIIDLHHLSSPPKILKHLYLHGRLEELPNWISSLSGLTKIILRWSRLEKDLLATLGTLPNLVELELRRAYVGKQLEFKDGQFPELKILLLDELEGIISMSLEKGTMQRLESLTISRCQWLERIPSGIERILTIRKLTFFDMSREFYDKIRADHEKDGYKKFKHIPEVYFTRWRAGEWETDQVESSDEAHPIR